VSVFMNHHGVTRQTFYRWRQIYGGLTEDEAQRLKRLERENARLKALIAERDLEIEVLREIHAKKGEPGGATRSGPLCGQPAALLPTSLCAAGRPPVDAGLSRTKAGARWRVARRAPSPGPPASAVRVSPHLGLAAPGGPVD
jgi:putative transposase